MTIWIASFPRSGNTMLRQVLHAGWGVLSGSMYADDLGDNPALIRACGHVELAAIQSNGRRELLNPHGVLIKTHARRPPKGPTIYILRDGREACVSFWHFRGKRHALDQIVRGNSFAGTWSDHLIRYADEANIVAWLEYGDLLERPEAGVEKLAAVFGKPLGDALLPFRDRNEMASRGGRWVRKQSDWRQDWSPDLDDLFWKHNLPAIERFMPEMERWRGAPSS